MEPIQLLCDFIESQEKINIKKIINNYKDFNYEDDEDCEIDLDYLCNTIFIKKPKKELKDKRNQYQYRQELLKKYNYKCVYCDNDDIDVLEAAHIIPYCMSYSLDSDNGLLLCANHHKTFDKYKWSINPITLNIEKGNKIIRNIQLDTNTVKYIISHYREFNSLKN